MFVGFHIATGGLFLGFDRALGGVQALFDVGKFLLVFGLYAQVIEAGLATAVGDCEIDTGVVQHPFGVIVLLNSGFAAEKGAVKLNALLQIVDAEMDM